MTEAYGGSFPEGMEPTPNAEKPARMCTKREMFAAMAMQRLMRPEFCNTNQEQFAHAELVACWATVYADALLKELGK